MKKILVRIIQAKIFWLTVFLAWTAIIIIFSLWPDTGEVILEETTSFRWDYLIHFVSYFLLGILFVLWRHNPDYRIKSTELTIFLIIGFILTLLTEYIQIFIPGRSFNIIDAMYNFGGILTGTFIGYFLIVRYFIKNLSGFTGRKEKE